MKYFNPGVHSKFLVRTHISFGTQILSTIYSHSLNFGLHIHYDLPMDYISIYFNDQTISRCQTKKLFNAF